MSELGWRCATCRTRHDDLPMCFGAEAPWRALVGEQEFGARVELDDDLCVIDDAQFFIRGQLELPVLQLEEPFIWSVWCSLSEKSFAHAMGRWEDAARAGDRYFGWLCTSLPTYPSTIHLKTNVISRPPGQAPMVEVQECEHPLFFEQQNGISLSRVRDIAHQLLHTLD